jgi:hypothetical protein
MLQYTRDEILDLSGHRWLRHKNLTTLSAILGFRSTSGLRSFDRSSCEAFLLFLIALSGPPYDTSRM